MKKAVIAVVAALILHGCTHNACTDCKPSCSRSSIQQVQSGFNEETYVWETFIFSTNRVDRP